MSKPLIWTLVFIQFLLSVGGASAQTNPPVVVASIKPLHALVSAVMAGVGEPELLIDGLSSPHGFALKPSMATSLQNADLVFWIGPDLETALINPLRNLAKDARVFGFQNLENGHGPHVWLDPQTAMGMVDIIANALVEFNPENSKTYLLNASNYRATIADMQMAIAQSLALFQTAPIVMFHDAYAHFQSRFNLNIVGVVAQSEHQSPGPRQINRIRQVIVEQNVTCIFAEPQFDPQTVFLVIEGTAAKSQELDPLGSYMPAGPAQYIELMGNMAAAIADCLGD